VLKRAVLALVPPPSTRRTRAKTALFSTLKKTSEKKFSFLFIEQIVIISDKLIKDAHTAIQNASRWFKLFLDFCLIIDLIHWKTLFGT
jgi:hypothetical protein